MTLGHHMIVSYLSSAHTSSPGPSSPKPGPFGQGGKGGLVAAEFMASHAVNPTLSMDGKMTRGTASAKDMRRPGPKSAATGPFSSITAESIQSRPMFLYFLVIAIALAVAASPSFLVGAEAAGRRSYHCSEYLYLNMRPSSQQESPFSVFAYSSPPNNPRVYDILKGRAIMLRRQGLVTHDRDLHRPNSWIRYGYQTRPSISRNKLLNSTDLIVEARVGWLRGRRPVYGECQPTQYKVSFFIHDQELISQDLTHHPRKPRPSNVRFVIPQSAWEPAARGLQHAAAAAATNQHNRAQGNTTATVTDSQGQSDENLRLTMQMMQRNADPTSPCLDRTSLYMKHLKLCRAAH